MTLAGLEKVHLLDVLGVPVLLNQILVGLLGAFEERVELLELETRLSVNRLMKTSQCFNLKASQGQVIRELGLQLGNLIKHGCISCLHIVRKNVRLCHVDHRLCLRQGKLVSSLLCLKIEKVALHSLAHG